MQLEDKELNAPFDSARGDKESQELLAPGADLNDTARGSKLSMKED